MPDEFRNKKVEVLIFPFFEKDFTSPQKKQFNPEEFEGILNLNPVDLENELHHMRNEWEKA